MTEYIISQAIPSSKNEKLKIIVNLKCNNIDIDCVEFLKKGFLEEYNKSIKEHRITDIKQMFLFILGIIFLFLSTLISNEIVWKEILLITGWVPIWEVVDLELFSDMKGRGKIKIIKKILNSEIIKKDNSN